MTIAPDLRTPEFLHAALGLLPRGRVWQREPGSVQVRFWSAVADRFATLHQRSRDLLETEADPARATETLGDWERNWGLPDECTPEGQSTAQRRAALLAKIAALGGQSRAYFIGVAAALGYAITITEFRPPVVDTAVADDPCCGDDWAFAWQVNMPDTLVIRDALADDAVADDPVRSWDASPLECVFARLRPAHTILLFAYGS